MRHPRRVGDGAVAGAVRDPERPVFAICRAVEQSGIGRIDGVLELMRLGAGGQTIKAIGAESRKELMAMYDVPIHLFLFVKVREKWADDPERYQEMGLEFPHGKG